MRRVKVALLLLLFSLGCSESKPIQSTPKPTLTPDPVLEEDSKTKQDRENAALVRKASMQVGQPSEDRTPELLEEDVRKVDDFLTKFQGTKAAEEVAIWRAKAGKVLDKWQAEDMKARGEPVKVPVGVLLSAFRENKPATDAKYQKKWLMVTGKVTKIIREPIYDPAVIRDLTVAIPSVRDDVTALTVELRDKPESKDVLECTCVVATLVDPIEKGKGTSLGTVKEGATVTILGKWLSPFSPLSPFLASRESCRLSHCELAE